MREYARVTSACITSRSKLSKPGPKHSYPIKGRGFLTSNANKRICECSISKHSATFKLFEYILIGGTICIEFCFRGLFCFLTVGPSFLTRLVKNDGPIVLKKKEKKLTWRIWHGTWPGPESYFLSWLPKPMKSLRWKRTNEVPVFTVCSGTSNWDESWPNINKLSLSGFVEVSWNA